jgi:peptide/nickel transport system substrate-binding protein
MAMMVGATGLEQRCGPPRSIHRRLAAVVGISALLFGCARPQADRPVRAAFGYTIESLDPVVDFQSLPLFHSIFQALTAIDGRGGVGPDLAQAWRSNADATQWTFTLRPDARWSDGKAVTAQDVVFTYRTVQNTITSANRQYLVTVRAIQAVGDHAVRFDLSRPFAQWPRQTALISVVPEAIYRKLGGMAFSDHPVGSGPYRVDRWQRSGDLVLKANPYYWNGPPPIKTVVVAPTPAESTRLTGLESGDLDVAAVPLQAVDRLRTDARVQVISTPSNKVVYIGFNVQKPPLDSLKLRQAIGYAIDRRAITQKLLMGMARPTGQLVAPVTLGYDPTVPSVAFDPERARRLIKQSGYAGQPIIFQYPTDGVIPLVNLVAQAVQGYLTRVGLNVRMEGMDQSSFIITWVGKKLQGMFMFSYNPPSDDAGMVTASLLGSAGQRYFVDPRMDRLEADQQAASSEAERDAAFGKMWRLSQQNAYYAPLFNDTYVYGTMKSRVILTPRSDGYILAQNLRAPPAASPVSGSPPQH